MNMINNIEREYFEWLCGLIPRKASYENLLGYLYKTPFIWIIDMDSNRARDGLTLRHEYAVERNDLDIELYFTGPCNVLEMMIALSIRGSRDYIGSIEEGCSVEDIFWSMIDTMHLTNMTDSNYKHLYVSNRVDEMLNRAYKPNGDGGLFKIKEKDADVRGIEIWKQFTWYMYELIYQN